MGSGFRTFTAGEVLTASNVQNYLMDQSVMVFGGSAARSSAIGTANFEEGMVSYLTDTDKVESYNGTNWVQVGSSNQGLTLINTTSFSAVASQSINDVFSSTYSNYRIIFDCSNSTSASMSFRVRVSGSDLTTNTYKYGHYINAYTTSLSGDGSSSSSAWVIGYADGLSFTTTLDLINPQATKNTFGLYACAHNSATFAGGALVNNSTSYTGFTIFGSAGTLTGTVRIYGYNQ